MKKVKKILVPLDFSTCSENALVFAIRLADKIDASINILNVPDFDRAPLENSVFIAASAKENLIASRKLMNQSLKKVKEYANDFIDHMPDLETDIEIGVPDVTIVDVAVRNQIDYIVMGTQGQNSIWDRFLGSVASKVINHAPCSVFVIPEKAKFKDEITLGYATNFIGVDAFEIWKTSKLMEPLAASIKCVHLNDKQKNINSKIEELERFFSENTLGIEIAFYSISVKNMVRDLNQFIDDENIDMMVMYKPKRNFFESIFLKSFTKEMSMHVEVPLLVLNENYS